ncbi:MAG: hypothetical protein ACFBSC_07285 [Microcoleaceae cyanobacterium]
MPFKQLQQSIKFKLQEIGYQFAIRERINQIPILQEIDRLREHPRYRDPKNLIPFGDKIYSQSDEDGIIREIFNRIGVTNKIFVEFGIGNGLENNTLALLFEEWKGLWIDASTSSVQKIRTYFSRVIENGQLKIVESFITKENINQLISSNFPEKEIDLLSVDIDGNDYHVLNAITCTSPRVVIVEYNAKFSPPVSYCMEYNPTHVWEKDDCFGASLKFFEVNLAKKGYCLVGCNISGVNAFFVRNDLVADQFLEPFTAENHYEPARYYLSGYFAGHPSTYKTLAQAFTVRSSSRLTDHPNT